MSEVVLDPSVLPEIRRHAEDEYPYECCGFLVTRRVAAGVTGPQRIHRVVRAVNAAEADRRRRYVISPRDLIATERETEASGELVAGFYHSHPEHPAVPSEFDRAHAWPWYAYLVLSIVDGHGTDLGAFRFSEERGTFERISWRVDPPSLPEIRQPTGDGIYRYHLPVDGSV